MLVSSAVLGNGMSHRCFQNSGMYWGGHNVQSMLYVALWRSSGSVFRCLYEKPVMPGALSFLCDLMAWR
jgi:hypothetical protein